MARYIQPSFAGGELSPQLHGRIDLAWYYNSVSLMSNMYSLKFGGARKRPGLQYIQPTKNNGVVRLVAFVAGTNLSYMIEFGNLYARFFFGGGPIEAAANGDAGPGIEVVFELVTPFTDADLYHIRFVQSKDVMFITHDILGIFKLRRLTSTTFDLVPFVPKWGPFKSENIDPYYVTVSAQEGPITVTSVDFDSSFLPFQWNGANDPQLEFGISFGGGSNNALGTDDPAFEVIKYGDQITISGTLNNDGTYNIAFVSGAGSYSRTIGIIASQTFVSEIVTTGLVDVSGGEVILPQPIFKPEDVGAYMRFRELTETENDKWEPDRREPVTGDELPYSNGQYATYADNVYENVSVTGPSGRRPPTHLHGTKPDGELPLPFLDWKYVFANQGYAKITAFISATEVEADVIVTIPFSYIKGNYLYSFSYWGDGDFGGVYYGFPQSIGFHQGRLWFGSSPEFPQTIWSSVSDDYETFKIEYPIQDDDGITHFIDSSSLSKVEHLMQLGELITFTNGAEWKIMPQGDEILTPASVGAFSQSFIGTGLLPPLLIDNDSLFLDTAQRRVYSFGYSMSADRYLGDDLSVKADHLFSGHFIKDWCYAREPNDIVWMARNDGVLIAMTYMPTQEIYAWHQHHTDGLVESVASVSYLGYDVVYAVVNRTIGGQTKRYIEFMQSDVFTDVADAFYVDSGLTYNGGPDDKKGMATFAPSALPAATAMTVDPLEMVFVAEDVGRTFRDINGINHVVTQFNSPTQVLVIPDETHDGGVFQVLGILAKQFSGLDHLDGKTITLLGDGSVYENLVVNAGIVSIDIEVLTAHMGLGYESHLETLDLEVKSKEGSNQGRKNNVQDCMLRVVNSRDILVGPNADQLRPLKAREDEQYNESPEMKNGDYIITAYPQWKNNARLHVANKTPTPLELSLIAPRIVTGGS